ncbi:MAG TPA: folylpolyglutamate synthase/dihydrofolate synthase family protein [Pyrinomonadaceae bacterium]|nr:folylpolyglutamate synthase/dihydrofolate synthase family protein [Pyrinomonadaceae bacterium]
MDFNESLSYLLSLGHETLAIKLGLRNTELLLETLGNPQHSFRSIQIAGTNGKGSTAVMVDAICQDARIRTGLFTSPHLVSITERIKIAGIDISPEDFAAQATRVRAAADTLIFEKKLQSAPTFFEHLTAIAFLAFASANVALAILETGLGGRLDSTTVAQAEIVALTPIAMDHEEYLGHNLAEIGSEKAAIVRRGSSAVIAPQKPEAMKVILNRCGECDVAPVSAAACTIESRTDDGRFIATFTGSNRQYRSVQVGLRGKHQTVNAATAISLAEALNTIGFKISAESIIGGIEKAVHAGRLERRGKYLFDGAHNPSAAETLKDYLIEFEKTPITLIFGAMRDKNLSAMTAALFRVASHVVLTQPDNPRAASIQTLQGLASEIGTANVSVTHSAAEALNKANEVTSADGVICVTGSLYLVGEIKALLLAAEFA